MRSAPRELVSIVLLELLPDALRLRFPSVSAALILASAGCSGVTAASGALGGGGGALGEDPHIVTVSC